MNDAEISRRLTLAIGYKSKDVKRNLAGGISVLRDASPQGYAVPGWYGFDYRDPAVIWPIAESFNCFPGKYRAYRYPGSDEILWSAKGVVSDTAAKAVALAVIRAHEGSKT